MIVKIFSNKGGGSAKASIDYLRGKQQNRIGATVLRGDPDLSLSIAESLEFKNKYTVGCLSFEERRIDEKAKIEIMDKFEKTMFAGMEKDQYNITWIEHTDKDRVELNFFVPNVELRTDKRLQPYYDKADRPLTHNFQTVINTEYGFSNPDAPEKRQTLKNDLTVPKSAKEWKTAIHEIILDSAANGKVQSQENLVEIFEKSGFSISRVTDKSISIKNPDGGRNLRFDGELYGKEFYEQTRTIEKFKEYIGSQQTGKRRESGEDNGTAYERAVIQLREETRKRSEKHQKLYPEQSRSNSHIHKFNDDNVRSLGVYLLADQHAERTVRKIEESTNPIRMARAVYQSRENFGIGGGRKSLHSNEREIGKELRYEGFHSSSDDKKIGIKGVIDELSRRTKEAIQRTRNGARVFSEKVANVGAYMLKSDERKQRISESKQRIDGSERGVEQFNESIKKFSQGLERYDEQAQSRQLEIRRTDNVIAEAQKPERKIEQSKSWSIFR